MMEIDPEPTVPTKRCPIDGCPCRALTTAGDRLMGAATFLDAALLVDESAVVIDFPPPRAT